MKEKKEEEEAESIRVNRICKLERVHDNDRSKGVSVLASERKKRKKSRPVFPYTTKMSTKTDLHALFRPPCLMCLVIFSALNSTETVSKEGGKPRAR